MLGDLTPPILSETVEAGQGSVGSPPPTDPVFWQQDNTAAVYDGKSSSFLDDCLIDELETLRRWQQNASRSHFELIESHQRRERELKARLDEAQQIIEASRWEVGQLQELKEKQRISLNLQEDQHQGQLREWQQALAAARQEIERDRADHDALRQRCEVLEQERDHRERVCNELEHQLAAARNQLAATTEQLSSRDASLANLQQRCDSLDQQRQYLELQQQVSARNHAARLQDLEDQLAATTAQLSSRDASLANLQQRCDSLDQQRQDLERQQQESERRAQELLDEQKHQRAAAQTPAEPDSGMELNDRETERLRDELIAVQQMLEELPEIFERKFRQRLQPLLDQRDWLLHQNNWLRAELAAARPELPAATGSEPAALPQTSRGQALLQSVQNLLRLRGRPR